MANPDNRPPHVFARDGLRSYPAAVRELEGEGQLHGHCRQRTRRYCNNRIEFDHRNIKRRMRAMQGPRTTALAWAVIRGNGGGTDNSQRTGSGFVLGKAVLVLKSERVGCAQVVGGLGEGIVGEQPETVGEALFQVQRQCCNFGVSNAGRVVR